MIFAPGNGTFISFIQTIPLMFRSCLAIILMAFTFVSFSQENEFQSMYIKNLHVDSCIIFKMVEGDSIPVKQVVNKVIFNAEGLVKAYYIMPEYEDADTVIKVYEYVTNKPVLKTTYGKDVEPIETQYIYQNGILVQELISGAEPRDYDIFVDNEGRMLEKNGKTAFPEIDSVTGESTGKMVWQAIDAYEYKYNKYKKVSEEIFNFYGQESYRAIYDYGPAGNMPLQKKTIYRYGNKVPDTEVLFTYTSNNLIASQEYRELEEGTSSLLEYEYFYAAPPAGTKVNPATPTGFTPPPPTKLPKGKGNEKVKDYKNPNW